MKKAASSRAKILKIVGPRYWKNLAAFKQGRCIYCGDPAEDQDHIPAITWLYALGTDHFVKLKIIPQLVPACKRCNGWLGSKPFHTLRQRKGFISSKLREFSRKLANTPRWKDWEIAEMGGRLKAIVNDIETVKAYLARREEWANSVFPWDEV